MKILAADFVDYEVNDFARAHAFYSQTLGLKTIQFHDKFWAEYEVQPTSLAIYCPQEMEKRPARIGGAAIALAVEDVQAALAEARQLGLPVAMEFIDTPVCHMAAITDPDGNGILLHHRKDGTCG